MAEGGRPELAGQILANGEYKLIERLGRGAFGDVYKAQCLTGASAGSHHAVKIEETYQADGNPIDQLYGETKMYLWLTNDPKSVNEAIPEVHSYGQTDKYNFMAMDLLGKSLEDLFTSNQRQFSLKTVLSIAVQTLQIFKFVHSKRLLHRDIKPDNFDIGYGPKANKIYLLDFGLCKKFQAITREGEIRHIEPAESKPLVGTPRYVSINTHVGGEHSRKDDLIGLSYMFLYFLKGNLPWQGKKNATDRK